MTINLVCITSILGRQQLEIVRGDGWFLFEYIYISEVTEEMIKVEYEEVVILS